MLDVVAFGHFHIAIMCCCVDNVIITYLSVRDHCEVNNGQHGCQQALFFSDNFAPFQIIQTQRVFENQIHSYTLCLPSPPLLFLALPVWQQVEV